MSTAKLGATEQRWAAQLAAFDFTIKHRPGRSNKNADALSRQNPAEVTSVNELGIVSGTPLPAPLQQVFGVKPLTEAVQATISVFPGHAPSDLCVLQEADPIIQEFLKFWIRRRGPDATERGQTSREVLELVRQWRRLVEQGGVLYRKVSHPRGEEMLQVLLPKSLQGQVLHQLHQEHGHQGVKRTIDLVSQRCYWPGMYHDIQQWCQECE